jgi:hypothetical protein
MSVFERVKRCISWVFNLLALLTSLLWFLRQPSFEQLVVVFQLLSALLSGNHQSSGNPKTGV